MTLFMRNDNIKIIWDVILMCPLFNELFTTEHSKKEWFNQRISKVEKQLGKDISIGDLRGINRDTIKLIMSDLKEHYLSISTDIASRPKPIIIGSDTDTPYMRRQNEYDKMKNVYVPTQIDFRSGEVDQPITNMSELIEKHVNERRKTLDIPSAFLSNNINDISWTSNTTGTIDMNRENDSSIDKKVTWTTPIVEQELVTPPIQNKKETIRLFDGKSVVLPTKNKMLDELSLKELSLKVDTVIQKMSFITNFLKNNMTDLLTKNAVDKKRERSVSL